MDAPATRNRCGRATVRVERPGVYTHASWGVSVGRLTRRGEEVAAEGVRGLTDSVDGLRERSLSLSVTSSVTGTVCRTSRPTAGVVMPCKRKNRWGRRPRHRQPVHDRTNTLHPGLRGEGSLLWST